MSNFDNLWYTEDNQVKQWKTFTTTFMTPVDGGYYVDPEILWQRNGAKLTPNGVLQNEPRVYWSTEERCIGEILSKALWIVK